MVSGPCRVLAAAAQRQGRHDEGISSI